MGKIGKIDAELFASFLAGRLGAARDEVIVGPKNGVDAGVVRLGNGKVLIVAEDPIFPAPKLSYRTFGWLTTHIGASDVAVTGISPQFLTYSLLMPPGTPDEDFEEITTGIHESCKELGIAIVGGHTGYYGGLGMPIIGGVTVFAVADENAYVTLPELLRFMRMALVAILGFFLASCTAIHASTGVTFGFLPCPLRFFTVWNSLYVLIMLCRMATGT